MCMLLKLPVDVGSGRKIEQRKLVVPLEIALEQCFLVEVPVAWQTFVDIGRNSPRILDCPPIDPEATQTTEPFHFEQVLGTMLKRVTDIKPQGLIERPEIELAVHHTIDVDSEDAARGWVGEQLRQLVMP